MTTKTTHTPMMKFGIAYGYITDALSDEAISINAKVIATPEKNADALAAKLVSQANVALDLLAALELCYEHCRLYHPEVQTNNVGQTVRAAIARAKGEKA